MTKRYFNKLVRDKIPEIIKSKGESLELKIVSPRKLLKLLKIKLIEESKEVATAKDDELVEELSDVLQVLMSICEAKEIKYEQVEKKRKEKEKIRGTFKKGVLLLWADDSKTIIIKKAKK